MKKLLFLFINLFLFVNLYSQFNFEEIYTPIYSSIKSISFYSNQGVFCGDGFIYKSTNNGLNWNEVYNDNSYILNDIKIINNNVIFCVGERIINPSQIIGVILKSTNGGSNWNELVTVFDQNPFYNISIINNHIYVGGYAGNVLYSSNAGNNWSLMGCATCNNTVYTVYDSKFIDFLNGIFVGYDGLVYKTTNAGINFSIQNVTNGYSLNGIAHTNANYITIGNNSNVYISTNSGINWYQRFLPETNITLKAIDTKNDLCIVVGSNRLFYSMNGGFTWKKQDFMGFTNFNNVLINDNNIYIVGDYGLLLRSQTITNISLDNDFNDNDFKIYPNPTSNRINLIFTPQNNNVIIDIFDINSKLVFNREYNMIANQIYTETIGLDSLSSGTYFIRYTSGTQFLIKKMIIIK